MPITKTRNIFAEFFDSEKMGGLLLLLCTITAMVIANTASGAAYIHFWHRPLDLSFSGVQLNYTVEQWVNDGLMAVFFLLVGLEIERELYIGELSDFKKALLPLLAATGGMLVPAAIHYFFNHGSATQDGIGIPMATDIAFALGMLSLLGSKVPLSVKIFLSAVAIIDDLGAVIVIAVFYTKGISLVYLGLSLGICALLLVLNRIGVKHLAFYLIPGLIMWYCMLQSGVHSTISAVLLAFTIPFKGDKITPSERVQHFLHKPVAFLILPIFALANTAILLPTGWYADLLHPNSLGVITGLCAGKPIGILLISLLAIQSKICVLPEGMQVKHLVGVGVLAGIGFTMSIFISNMAFDDSSLVQSSKIAVLAASLLACTVGLSILSSVKNHSLNA